MRRLVMNVAGDLCSVLLRSDVSQQKKVVCEVVDHFNFEEGFVGKARLIAKKNIKVSWQLSTTPLPHETSLHTQQHAVSAYRQYTNIFLIGGRAIVFLFID
jgi:hypothetical protein